MEVYNQNKSSMFGRYVRSILDAKMLEVCATTLPQMIIPRVYGDPRYEAWGRQRRAFFAQRARRATEILSACQGVIVNEPRGAFYLSLVFSAQLNDSMNLRIEDRKMEDFLRQRCPEGMSLDRKFVYQLLGSKQICVVPLSGFVCDLPGFRVTLLERDDAKFEQVFQSIADSVKEFVASG
jgi:aspartate/methionine/tyrosine aminotransferase